MSSVEHQLVMVETFLTKRIEALESKVSGGTCTWDLKDNVPVSACRPERYIPRWAVERVDVMAFCPFCSRRIEVVR